MLFALAGIQDVECVFLPYQERVPLTFLFAADILDKPLESIFGYISVLPGAFVAPLAFQNLSSSLVVYRFSAYRYKALLNGTDGLGPLQTYFLGEKMHEPGAVASLAECGSCRSCLCRVVY